MAIKVLKSFNDLVKDGIIIHARTPHALKVRGQWAGMTIKKIAKAEGISINEAQRRRDRGDYAR